MFLYYFYWFYLATFLKMLMPFSFFFGSQLEGVRIAASKMSPMMETINMVNVNIIVKCQFYVCGL